MSYAISVVGNVPRIIQSGVDTALAGIDTMIAAVAAVVVLTPYVVGDVRKPPAANGMWYRCTTLGTTAAVAPLYDPTSGSITTDGTAIFTAFAAPVSYLNGSLRVYSFPEVDFSITATLTIANPMFETWICRMMHSTSTCIYTSGSFMADGVTPKFNGTHFKTVKKGANDFQEVSNWNGAWSIRGGTIDLAASVKPEGTAAQIFYNVTFVSSANWSRSIRFRAYNTQTQFLNNCSFYNIAFDAFNVPSAVSAKGYASEYVLEYVGSAAGGTDSKMVVSALSNQDGQFDFDNYGGGWIEFYDCKKGAALNIQSLANDPRHCTPLFQNISFTVTNLQGAAQDNVRYSTTDAPTNSPTVTITTASSLKTWDFRNPITLTGITAGGGLVSSVPCLKVWHGATNIQNLRYPASTATYLFCGYAIRKLSKAVILGADAPMAVGIAGEAATNLTLTEAQAAALTGIAMAPSGQTTGTATITVARTTMELWQYFRQWIGLNFATRDDTWLPSSGVLSLGAWGLTSNVVITAASGFSELATTGIISSTLASGGAYTYSNGTLTLPLTLPTLTAGTMNIGAAGTFAFLTNSSIVAMTPVAPSAYIFTGAHTGTLDLRNAAAHAITVTLPLGTAFTTASNVGGVITVVNPAQTLQILRPNIINGSNFVILNTTQLIEVASGTTSGGGGINVTLTKGTHYNAADALEIRIGYCVALVAKLPIAEQLTAPTLTTVNSAPTAQSDHTVYNAIAINGSTVTGFAADYVNDDVNVTLGADFLGQNFMAWWVYNESTLGGLRDFVGLYTLVDEGNMRNNTALALILLDNTTTTDIKQIDNVRIFRSDAGYPVKSPSSGGGAIDVNWRNPVLVTGLGAVAQDVRIEMDANSTKFIAIKAKTDLIPAIPASSTNITAGTITTVTNLTNAPTAGDLTATMKASVTAAVPTVVQMRTEMDANSTKLDVATSTRLASASYTVPPTVVAIRNEIDANSTKLTVPTSSLETTANANANAAAAPAVIFAGISETGQSYGKQIRDIRATLLGKTAGGGTTTETFLAADGATARVVSTNNGTDRTNVSVPGA